MALKYTQRGFGIIESVDNYGEPFTLQQSSLALVDGEGNEPGAGAIWLGAEPNRMHLSKSMVQELVGHLNTWLETGQFVE